MGHHHTDERASVRPPPPRVERPPTSFKADPDPGIRVTVKDGEAVVRVSLKSAVSMFPDEEPFRRPRSWLLAEAAERLRAEARRVSLAEAGQGLRYDDGGARGGGTIPRRAAG